MPDTAPSPTSLRQDGPEHPAPGGRLHAPAAGERELTARALVAGSLLGGVVAAMNLYFGLKTGWTVGGSLLAAILAYALFAALRPRAPFTVLENNASQTAASAAGWVATAAGLLTAIPALRMLGRELGAGELALWALATSFVGVAYAVPLRRRMVVEEALPFPSGVATAETLVAMGARGDDAIRKASALVRVGLAAAVFTLVAYFVPPLQAPPMAWLGLGGLTAYGLSLYLSPVMIGAGLLVGPRIGASLLLGALLAWAVLAPWVEAMGWVSGAPLSFKTGARGWLLWPGVGCLVAESLVALAFEWRAIVRTFTPRAGGTAGAGEAVDDAPAREQVPSSAAWLLFGGASVLTIALASAVFGIAPWLTAVAVALSAVLAAIATRATGETDINPIGGVAKVTQLAYGALAPAAVTTNLLAAAITGAGATQAADLMTDLKTGHLVGASPRKQLVAQLVGVVAGIAFSVPLFFLFDAAYGIGSEALPAPSAQSWRAVAEVLAVGVSALPPRAEVAGAVGLAVGAAFAVARRAPSIGRYVPSALAIGVAFLVQAYFSIAMFVGAMLLVLWRRRAPAHAALYAMPVAAGLLAGEGLMGVVTAGLTLFGVEPVFAP